MQTRKIHSRYRCGFEKCERRSLPIFLTNELSYSGGSEYTCGECEGLDYVSCSWVKVDNNSTNTDNGDKKDENSSIGNTILLSLIFFMLFFF